jgi:phage tail-like protein
MANSERKDPVLGFHFAVEISGLLVAGFSEVSGLQAEIEVQEFREGGVNEYMHKRAGPTKYASNLILKKGVTDSKELWSWYSDVMRGTVQRKQVSVVLMSSSGDEKRRWKLQNAYPVKWSGPDLKATASEVAIETLELAHEGLIPQ